MTSRLLLLVLSLVATPAFATESADAARMGRDAWAAFECSGLAGEAQMVSTQESLAAFGYAQGKKFLDVYLANKVASDDIVSDVPLAMIMLAAGPNADFMLGRMYETATRVAIHGVAAPEGEDARMSAAREQFKANECGRFESMHPAVHMQHH